jgi:Domain of unknown function (DUF4168)
MAVSSKRASAGTAVALSIGMAVGAPAVWAQAPAPAPTPSPSNGTSGLAIPTPAGPNVSDQKLDATAKAMEQVASLHQKYARQLASAPSADKDRIADEAHGAIGKAVTDHGLSVEEYNSILETAQSDPDVRGRLLQKLSTPPGEPGK